MKQFFRFLLLLFIIPSLLVSAQDDTMRPITSETIGDISHLATLGHGVIRNMVWTPDASALVVGTEAGIWLHPLENFASGPTVQLENDGSCVGSYYWDGLVKFAFSPDGKYLVCASHWETIIWDWETRQQIVNYEYRNDSKYIAFTDDGDVRQFETTSQGTRVIDLIKDEVVAENLSPVTYNGYSPDGKYVIIQDTDNQLYALWDVEAQTQREVFEGDYSFTFSPDNMYFITNDGEEVVFRTVDNPDPVLTLEAESPFLDNWLWSSDGCYFVLENGDVWDLVEKEKIAYVDNPRIFGPSAINIADKVAFGFDHFGGIAIAPFNEEYHHLFVPDFFRTGAGGIVTVPAYNANNTLMVVADDNNVLHIFDLLNEIPVTKYHYLDIGSTPVVSPDGRYALTRTSARWSDDSGYPLYRNTKHVVQIDLDTFTIKQVFDLDTLQDDEYGGGYYRVFSWGKLGYTKDGASIVVLDTDRNELTFFSADTGEFEQTIPYSQENVANLIHDPNRSWEAPFRQLNNCNYGCSSIAYSSDEQVYIQGDIVYSAEDDTPILTLVGHTLPIFASLITPDDRYFVTASFDGTVRLWDTRTGAEIRKWQLVPAVWDEMHQQRFGLSLSPDGSMIESAGQLLDIETGERYGSGGIFSPDSRFIFRFNSGTLEIWGIEQ